MTNDISYGTLAPKIENGMFLKKWHLLFSCIKLIILKLPLLLMVKKRFYQKNLEYYSLKFSI